MTLSQSVEVMELRYGTPGRGTRLCRECGKPRNRFEHEDPSGHKFVPGRVHP